MGLYSEAKKLVGGETTNLFMKLEAGKTRVRILDYPRVSTRVFSSDEEVQTRFAWPVWDYEAIDGVTQKPGRVRILEKGPGFLNKIEAIVGEYGEDLPMKCDLVITATGDGLQRRYDIIPAPVRTELPSTWQEGMPDMADKVKDSVPFAKYVKVKGEELNQALNGDAAEERHRQAVEDAMEAKGEPADVSEIPDELRL